MSRLRQGSVAAPALLQGPDLRLGPESWTSHQDRLGPLPPAGDLPGLLDAAGLRGRGGAAFPVGRKWRAVAERRAGRPVVLANGAEGEPLSRKDRVLMEGRPHLVLDGALLAAAAVGAGRVILYVGEEHGAAAAALGGALRERRLGPRSRPAVQLLAAPRGYVSGEETAAASYASGGPALPTMRPPRPFERGVSGRPTLIQNVETLAMAALIARGGVAWYRALGRAGAAGSLLITVSGAVAAPGVAEVPAGSTLADAVAVAGGLTTSAQAVLLGGQAGAFLPAGEAWHQRLDPEMTRLGCGVVSILPEDHCGVAATAEILTSIGNASAGQCGPCRVGLPAIAAAARRLADGSGDEHELDRLRRWSGMVAGRGACGHPDGASLVLRSALDTFAEDFAAHQHGFGCVRARQVRRIA